MTREDGFFDDLARGLADGTLTRGKALRLMGAAVVGERWGPSASVRHLPTLSAASATGRTVRGTPSAVAETASAKAARRRPLPPPRRALRRPRLRRRLGAYRMALPAPTTPSAVAEPSAPTASVAPRIARGIPVSAPPTVSAAAASAGYSLAVASAHVAVSLAAPAPPANLAVPEGARTEPVATLMAIVATPTLTAVIDAASTAYATGFDCLPNSSPCTRSGHGASVAAPGPSCPHAAKYMETGVPGSSH